MTAYPADTPAAVLITAAGSGTRMGGGIKKEYRLVQGKPVLVHALMGFQVTGKFSHIVVTLPPADLSSTPDFLSSWVDLSMVEFIAGGQTRQESVNRGLQVVKSFFGERTDGCILIHDGARPWIEPELVLRVLEGTIAHGACLPVLPAVYAMKMVDAAGFIEHHLDRSNLVSAQTPQGFRYSGILSAHEMALRDGYTGYDDTELYGRYIGKVYAVPGDPRNIKITYNGDLEVSS